MKYRKPYGTGARDQDWRDGIGHKALTLYTANLSTIYIQRTAMTTEHKVRSKPSTSLGQANPNSLLRK